MKYTLAAVKGHWAVFGVNWPYTLGSLGRVLHALGRFGPYFVVSRQYIKHLFYVLVIIIVVWDTGLA